MFKVRKKHNNTIKTNKDNKVNKSFIGKKRSVNSNSTTKETSLSNNTETYDSKENKNIIRISLENEDDSNRKSTINENINASITEMKENDVNNIKKIDSNNYDTTINKKEEDFDKICYICEKQVKECTTFNNEYVFIKYLDKIINTKKILNNNNSKENESINKNFEKIKVLLKNNVKFLPFQECYCENCLLNLLSSLDINIFLANIRKKNRKIINKIEKSKINKDENISNKNIINDSNEVINNMNRNQEINYSNNSNYLFGLDNTTYENTNINSLIKNLPIIVCMIKPKTPLKIIYFDLMRMNNNLYLMYNMLINFQKFTSTKLSVDVVKEIWYGFKKLFKFNFNIIKNIDKYLKYLEIEVLRKTDNKIENTSLINEIKELTILNKQNYDQLFYIYSYYIKNL